MSNDTYMGNKIIKTQKEVIATKFRRVGNCNLRERAMIGMGHVDRLGGWGWPSFIS